METENPLFTSQREKAGATTFDKFDYQYHWALFELLKKYQREEVSLVFVELHEDVVFADSESVDAARFLFCQIKGTSKNWTRTALLRRSKGKTKREKENSVLGKILMGPCTKKIEHRLTALELVATSSFNLQLKEKGLELVRIRLDDLHEDEVSAMQASLLEELGDTSLLHKVAFRKSELPTESYPIYTIGLIAEILANRSPGSKVDVKGVYLSLIDELHRKGKVSWDYANWDELVRQKGVHTSRIGELFSALSDAVDVGSIVQFGVKQFEFWGYTPKQLMTYEKLLRKHALKVLTDRSLSQLSILRALSNVLLEKLDGNPELSREQLDECICNSPAEVRAYVQTEDDLRVLYAITYLSR